MDAIVRRYESGGLWFLIKGQPTTLKYFAIGNLQETRSESEYKTQVYQHVTFVGTIFKIIYLNTCVYAILFLAMNINFS